MAFAWNESTYQVFLSFRGVDTRKNFTDHLYTALTKAGIHTFRDDRGIHRGENIQSEIENAIKESRLSVIVLSKDYASSPWCLDELVMIMERKRKDGHIVLPVFYDASPSQVWNQTGSYAEAFAKHENEFQDDLEMVQSWREALKKVADLGGMVLEDRHEAQFIQDIIEVVEKKLSSMPLFGSTFTWNKYSVIMRRIKLIAVVVWLIFFFAGFVFAMNIIVRGWKTVTKDHPLFQNRKVLV